MVAYPGDQGSLDRRSMDLHFIQKIKIFLQQVHLQQVHQNDIDLEIWKNERTRSKAVFQPKRVGWSLGVALWPAISLASDNQVVATLVLGLSAID